MYTLRVAGLLFLFSCVAAEIVSFENCNIATDDDDDDEVSVPVPSNCTVHEVRITPCPEAADDAPCKLKRGKNARIEFEFTTDVAATVLKQRAYWTNTLVDLPLAGMESNACLYSTCPVTAGQRQSYSYQLHISKKFPTRAYDVKWKLYEESTVECCFIYKIRLHK